MSSDRAYAEHDLALALTFAAAARDAGVGRIIYLGGLGEMGSGLSEHLESRRHVETALASTGVPVTVLRAAMIIGSGSASFEIMRYLVQRLPVMITPTWVSTRCQPIAIENVLGYLVGVLSSADTTGEVFDIGGGDPVLPGHHAHHGRGTGSATPMDPAGATVDPAIELTLDSARHALEPSHRASADRGSQERSGLP